MNVEFGRIYTLLKMHIYSKLLTQNMWSIGAIICIFNNNLQKISFKKKFKWKNEKWLKRIHILCKVIPFAPVYILAPKF
jgi:hypothetical protein